MEITSLFNISGKVAVVTGGSRGIGEMITAGFLANGVKVYISARKAPALAEKAKDCLLYTSPSPRDATLSRMPSSA